jgi:plasmid rolling circle replication initiator protein Rep
MDWKEYNEKLVRRGELLLDLEFLKTWDQDISVMNRKKTGRQEEDRQALQLS